MVVIVKKILILLFLNFLISTKIYGSIILDYETEEFLKKINNLILSVNDYKDNIKFKIIFDEDINAFVNQNNEIFISSGLIKNSTSYIDSSQPFKSVDSDLRPGRGACCWNIAG